MTTHSKFYSTIKKFYTKRIYTKDQVASFVNGPVISITPEEYKEIIGEDYIVTDSDVVETDVKVETTTEIANDLDVEKEK